MGKEPGATDPAHRLRKQAHRKKWTGQTDKILERLVNGEHIKTPCVEGDS